MRKNLLVQHPEITLGGLIALLTVLVGFLRGFASPAFGEWLTLGGAYWGFVLPVIVALKDYWTPRAALITAGAGLVWMLAFASLVHESTETVFSAVMLFSTFVSAVIYTLQKNARPKAPENSPRTEPPGA